MCLKLIDYIKYTLHLQHKTLTLLKTSVLDRVQFITNLPAPFQLKNKQAGTTKTEIQRTSGKHFYPHSLFYVFRFQNVIPF